jgi:hypothetical protein
MSLRFPQNWKWKVRFTIFLLLIVPFYVLPSLGRSLWLNRVGWLVGILAVDALGTVVVGFFTNSYRFAFLLYCGATALEVLLLMAGYEPRFVLWIGDLFPALVAIYFAQQIYVNMGD